MKNYKNLSTAIHKEGYVFIVISIIVMLFLSSFSTFLFWMSFLATLFCIYFFRNPERFTPNNDSLVISPADGIVVSISRSLPPSELNVEDEMTKISIFLSPFNVHVNRVPITGKVTSLQYNPGRFFNASLDKASAYNERQSILLEHANTGEHFCVVQIAGLIARRIVCDLEDNMEVKSGERFGIIRFGSRVDLYLPTKYSVLVTEGSTMIGGETVIADISQNNNENKQFIARN